METKEELEKKLLSYKTWYKLNINSMYGKLNTSDYSAQVLAMQKEIKRLKRQEVILDILNSFKEEDSIDVDN